MATFDVLIHGGTVVDGTGAPGRHADVGVSADRIVAIGDVAGEDNRAAIEIDATDRVVTPGFIDPHGHSDGSLFLDGALASHLRQGFTTQLSGNCGDSLAPITDRGRELVDLALRANQLEATWRTFAEFLDRVDEQSLGPNVAFLVGHGTVRGAVIGADARPASNKEHVRERGALTLEAAVAKLTSVPAERLRLRDRGVLREGAFADIVVFDSETVSDRATYEQAAVYPQGIEHVLVNGRAAILNGQESGERPGRLLRRA